MKLFKTPIVFRWFFPRRTWGFSSIDEVYLTFDDGPDPEITPFILDFLADRNLKACFFCVGENVEKYPQIFERIKREGHLVGSHTMKHEKGTACEWSDYKSSVAKCQQLVGGKLFRPPYGRIRAWQSFLLAKKYQIIMWTWLSYDYDRCVSIDEILYQAKKIKPGDILLLHDNRKVKERVTELLPQLIDQLEDRGLKFGQIPV